MRKLADHHSYISSTSRLKSEQLRTTTDEASIVYTNALEVNRSSCIHRHYAIDLTGTLTNGRLVSRSVEQEGFHRADQEQDI